jgi:hypothetical protein
MNLSPVYKFYHKSLRISRNLSLLFLLVLLPAVVHAQMFSVDNEEKETAGIPGFGIYAGVEPMDFNYTGNNDSFGAAVYSFSANIVRFKLETPFLNIFLGTAGGTTGLDNFSYFNAGINLGYAIPLLRKKNVLVFIPLQGQTTLTRVGNNETVSGATPLFSQGTFDFGTGLEINARLAPSIRIKANGIPRYGFTYSTRERDGGGNVKAIDAQGRLYFDELFGEAGLSLGYDYSFRSFDINDLDALNYDATAHSILIGITF